MRYGYPGLQLPAVQLLWQLAASKSARVTDLGPVDRLAGIPVDPGYVPSRAHLEAGLRDPEPGGIVRDYLGTALVLLDSLVPGELGAPGLGQAGVGLRALVSPPVVGALRLVEDPQRVGGVRRIGPKGLEEHRPRASEQRLDERRGRERLELECHSDAREGAPELSTYRLSERLRGAVGQCRLEPVPMAALPQKLARPPGVVGVRAQVRVEPGGVIRERAVGRPGEPSVDLLEDLRIGRRV